ncbi:uncharacterized membrane protein YsdA (DUF1294 family) [Sphingomonas kyeonggiensis]|uniref:DUF1294 domain-containing protein n=1 Tax=Sphingomonas kyeonggiensis TaxID=1268553 RepID=UPI0027890FC3|nr:DUF1294 domain-containing protein [Sphingomonas kyeonggiensis]MDQ0252142.1 uncharacterized membrane protein YsdA (DUF1294 family) [Sphingomonas kyeonggiensis]
MLIAAFTWVLLINLWTILRFWQDKRRAVAGMRRIPEADLLGLALIGGSLGAFAARRLFRHKTRKRPFTTRLWLIALGQLGIGAGLLIFSLRA